MLLVCYLLCYWGGPILTGCIWERMLKGRSQNGTGRNPSLQLLAGPRLAELSLSHPPHCPYSMKHPPSTGLWPICIHLCQCACNKSVRSGWTDGGHLRTDSTLYMLFCLFLGGSISQAIKLLLFNRNIPSLATLAPLKLLAA